MSDRTEYQLEYFEKTIQNVEDSWRKAEESTDPNLDKEWIHGSTVMMYVSQFRDEIWEGYNKGLLSAPDAEKVRKHISEIMSQPEKMRALNNLEKTMGKKYRAWWLDIDPSIDLPNNPSEI